MYAGVLELNKLVTKYRHMKCVYIDLYKLIDDQVADDPLANITLSLILIFYFKNK